MIEQKVSETILQTPKKVQIAGEFYQMTPPSYATLILFSSFIGSLPKENLNTQNPIASLLSQKEHFTAICKAIATMVLGAKEFQAEVIKQENKKKGFFSFFKTKKQKSEKTTKGEILTEKILHADIEEIANIFMNLLSFMKLQDFFQLTTSLIEMNIIKPTAEVETKTTALGQ